MIDSDEQGAEKQPKTGWFAVAMAATVLGAVPAVVFAFYQFTQKGGCGFVRFYEHAAGTLVLGGWLAGLGVGMGLATHGFLKQSKCVVPGALIAVAVNCLMLVTCILTVRAIRDADYSLKSPELLLELLDKGDLYDQKLAAHELGNSKVLAAVPFLCQVLDDGTRDINLRHNAAGALGKICALSRQEDAHCDGVVESLTMVLAEKDEYLPDTVAEALGRIGEPDSVPALAELLQDAEYPRHTREAVVHALAGIGSDEAWVVLDNVRAVSEDEDLIRTIDRVMDRR